MLQQMLNDIKVREEISSLEMINLWEDTLPFLRTHEMNVITLPNITMIYEYDLSRLLNGDGSTKNYSLCVMRLNDMKSLNEVTFNTQAILYS